MPKTTSAIQNYLKLLFQNTTWANIGDATGIVGSTVAGSLYASLHSAAPGLAGTQSTSELSYTGYARVAIARSGAGWTQSSAQVVPAATITFGQRTDAGAAVEALFWGVGRALAGVGELLYYGPLTGANLTYAATAVATTDTIVVPGSAYSVNDRIVVLPAAQSTMPAGLTDGTIYYIKTASSTSYTLSLTAGGAVVDITADGACLVAKLSTLTIGQNTTPSLTTASVIVES